MSLFSVLVLVFVIYVCHVAFVKFLHLKALWLNSYMSPSNKHAHTDSKVFECVSRNKHKQVSQTPREF